MPLIDTGMSGTEQQVWGNGYQKVGVWPCRFEMPIRPPSRDVVWPLDMKNLEFRRKAGAGESYVE